MATSAASPEKLTSPYGEDVSTLLGYAHVPRPVQQNYVDFLARRTTRLTPDIHHASISLGKLYVASLQFPIGEPYEHGEQTIMGLVIGRTVRERPQPVEDAVEQYALHFTMLNEDKAKYVHLFSSGIGKLRLRAESSPRLKTEADRRLAHAFELKDVGRPSWLDQR